MPSSGVMSASANPAFIAGASATKGRSGQTHANAAITRQLAVCRSFLIPWSPQLHPIPLDFFAIIETPAAPVVVHRPDR
jgi:hypothetical protein